MDLAPFNAGNLINDGGRGAFRLDEAGEILRTGHLKCRRLFRGTSSEHDERLDAVTVLHSTRPNARSTYHSIAHSRYPFSYVQG